MDGQVGAQWLGRLSSPGQPALGTMLDVLERSGIRAALIRDPGASEGSVSEIDLLADPLPDDVFERALASLGFVRLPAWGHEPHRFYLAYAEDVDRWQKLDLVTSIAFGRLLEFPVAPAEPFLDRASRRGDERRLAADDEFWLLLLHCLLDKGAIRLDHSARLAELAPRAGNAGPGAAIAASALPEPLGADGARALATTRDSARLESAAEPTRRRLARRRPVRVTVRRAVNGQLRRLSKLQTLLSRRGLRVVLLGPDGAGKSTLAAGLDFPFPVRRLYAGLYPAGSAVHRRAPGVDLAARLVRLRVVSIRARFHQLRGRLVVFDRYTLDARLSTGKLERPRTRARRWLLGHACPLPDLVVVLDAPAALLHARKAEHSLESLDAQRRHYLALEGDIPHVVVVDASRSPEAVRRRVTALVWERYRQKWGGGAARAASFRDGRTVA